MIRQPPAKDDAIEGDEELVPEWEGQLRLEERLRMGGEDGEGRLMDVDVDVDVDGEGPGNEGNGLDLARRGRSEWRCAGV